MRAWRLRHSFHATVFVITQFSIQTRLEVKLQHLIQPVYSRIKDPKLRDPIFLRVQYFQATTFIITLDLIHSVFKLNRILSEVLLFEGFDLLDHFLQ